MREQFQDELSKVLKQGQKYRCKQLPFSVGILWLKFVNCAVTSWRASRDSLLKPIASQSIYATPPVGRPMSMYIDLEGPESLL